MMLKQAKKYRGAGFMNLDSPGSPGRFMAVVMGPHCESSGNIIKSAGSSTTNKGSSTVECLSVEMRVLSVV